MTKNHISFSDWAAAEIEKEWQLEEEAEEARAIEEAWREYQEATDCDEDMSNQLLEDACSVCDDFVDEEPERDVWDKPWNCWRNHFKDWEEYELACEYLGFEIYPGALPF